MGTNGNQIGSPQGYAKADPSSFSNSKLCGNEDVMPQVNSERRGPTTQPATKIGGTGSADGVIKDSAGPKAPNVNVEGIPVNYNVRVGTASAVENYGK